MKFLSPSLLLITATVLLAQQQPSPTPAPATPAPAEAAAAVVAAPAVAPARDWLRLEVEKGLFTGEKLGLLETEIEPLASFLAIYSYREYAQGIWEGDLACHVMARRFLGLAFNLAPQNTEAKAINSWLFLKTKHAQLPELPMSQSLFVDSLVRIIDRLQTAQDTTDTIRLAVGYLSLAGAELAPENESLVYHAERFLRAFAHNGAAWRELHQGKHP